MLDGSSCIELYCTYIYIYTQKRQSLGRNVCVYLLFLERERENERENRNSSAVDDKSTGDRRAACFLRQLLWSLDTCENNRFIRSGECSPLYNENSQPVSVDSRQVGVVSNPCVYIYIYIGIVLFKNDFQGLFHKKTSHI